MVRGITIALFITQMTWSPVIFAQTFIPDLPAGSIYHLVFVTEKKRDATSSRIEDYDDFVNAEAARDPDLADIKWSALVSTPTVPALAHVDLSGPTFFLHGTPAWEDTNIGFDLKYGLFDSSPTGELPFEYEVWTGDIFDPSRPQCPLGNTRPHCENNGVISSFGHSASGDLTGWNWGYRTFPPSDIKQLVAVSEPLKVPEPSSIAFLLSAIVFFCYHRTV